MNKVLSQPTIALMNHPAVMDFMGNVMNFRRMIRLTRQNKKYFKGIFGKQICCFNGRYRMWVWQTTYGDYTFTIFTGKCGTAYEIVSGLKIEEFADNKAIGRHCVNFLRWMEKMLRWNEALIDG